MLQTKPLPDLILWLVASDLFVGSKLVFTLAEALFSKNKNKCILISWSILFLFIMESTELLCFDSKTLTKTVSIQLK